MADDLTADDLRRSARHYDEGGVSVRLHQAADLMNQGWRLTPPHIVDMPNALRLSDGRTPEQVGDWTLFCALYDRERVRATTARPYENVVLASACACHGALHEGCWRLTSPPQPGTTATDVRGALEVLRSVGYSVYAPGGERVVWGDCDRDQTDPQTVTVNADDLEKALWPYTDRELRAAQARLAAALAGADRDR